MRDKLIELINHAKEMREADAMDIVRESECDLFDKLAALRSEAEYISDHLIANGVVVQEWIPVSDRLPEEREGWGFTSSDVVIIAGKRHDGSLYVSQDTTTDGKWNTTTPLYWMQLPEPPKGE